MSVILLRRELTEQYYRDLIAAANVLIPRYFPGGVHYAIEPRRLKGTGIVWGLCFWKGPRHSPDGGLAWIEGTECIAGAGPLKQLRGGE